MIKHILLTAFCLLASVSFTEAKGKKDCKSKIKFTKTNINQSTVEGLYTIQLSFGLKEKSDMPSDIKMVIELRDCKGNIQKVSASGKYDEKTGLFVVSHTMKQEKDCEYKFNGATLEAKNECDEVKNWVIELGDGKSKEKITQEMTEEDDEKSDFGFKKMNINESTVDGIYGIQLHFGLKKNSEMPSEITMIIELEDCNGNIQKISVKGTYDKENEIFVFKQAIKQDKNCKYQFVGASFKTVSKSGETDNWVVQARTENIKKALSEAGAEVEIK